MPTDITPVETQAQIQVFGGEPDAVVKTATKIATALAPLIEQKKLYAMINGKKHVMAEGWATMGAMLGVFPEVEWTHKIEAGWEARVILKTINGNQISAGEAMCTRAEKNWANRDDFALRSMAQTRATGKAFRLGFAWIIAMAGYSATPLEEMDGVNDAPPKKNATQGHTGASTTGTPSVNQENIDKPASNAQIQAIYSILTKKLGNKPREEVNAGILETYKVDMTKITMGQASQLIQDLQGK